jgi:hypothetical protein
LFQRGIIYFSTSSSLENFWQYICSASLLITFIFREGKWVYKMTILPCVPVYLCPHVSGLNQLTNFHTIYYRHARSQSTSYFLTFRR